MPSGIATNRTNIDLPNDVSSVILQDMQEQSVIMRLAQQIALPGRGLQIPVITGDPEASWVSETGAKPVSNPSVGKKIMQAHKLAVIVPFSDEFRRDVGALYNALVGRLPGVLANKFDKTVLFGPDSGTLANFDNLSGVTAHALDTANSTLYKGLVAADTDISEHGGTVNGYVFSPQGRGMLLSATDTTNRPIFINDVSEDAVPRILGAPTYFTKVAYKEGTSGGVDVVGFAGDWNHAMYGVVQGVTTSISTEATLTYTDGGQTRTVNLFQSNMFAVRAEIEVGFICQADYFNKLTRAHA